MRTVDGLGEHEDLVAALQESLEVRRRADELEGLAAEVVNVLLALLEPGDVVLEADELP